MNCQCPVPDYFLVPSPRSHLFIKHDVLSTDLHGKKGTRACRKCHQLLCVDCVTIIKDEKYSWYYCQDCKEEH